MSEAAYKARALSVGDVFSVLDPADLEELARIASPSAILRGRAFKPGAQNNIFFIQSGAAAVLKSDHEGAKPVLTALLGPGSICGLEAVLHQNTQAMAPLSTLQSLSDVSALTLSVADILRIARRSPNFSVALMEALAAQTQETAARMAESLSRPLELRLAKFLSQLSEKLVQDDWRPSAMIGRLSQSFIADMLGVSREHINRTLTMWEKSGLVFQNKSGEIIIHNRKRLRAIASDENAAAQSKKNKDHEWLREIDACLDLGLNQSAFDLAVEAAKRAPRDIVFRHRAVLSAARSGAMEEAFDLIDEFNLSANPSDEETACLRPRLLRDKAFTLNAKTERTALLKDAATDYENVFKACQTHYSGVNAASSYAMAGDAAQAKRIAEDVEKIAQIDLKDLDEDEDAYWLRASLAECALLKGDKVAAAGLFREASTAPDVTAGKKSTTRRQLIRLREAANIDMDWITGAVPQGRTAFFAGPISRDGAADVDALKTVKQAVQKWARTAHIEWACGALAAGADIAIAETLLEEGAQLHVCLPLEPSLFFKTSIAPFGEEWPDRFAACMRAATSVEWNPRAEPTGAAYALGAHVAMGKTLRQAQGLETTPEAFFALPKISDGDTLSEALLGTWRTRGFSYASQSAVWAARPEAVDENDSAVIYASIFEFTESAPATFEQVSSMLKGASTLAAIPLFADNKGRTPKEQPSAGGAFLFKTAKDAISAAHLIAASPLNSKTRSWLDVGVFASDTLQDLGDGAIIRSQFLTASCRPTTALGKIYASDLFANAATMENHSAAFDYIGYASGQEKHDPCPLYLLENKN